MPQPDTSESPQPARDAAIEEIRKTLSPESLQRYERLFKQHGERLKTAEPGNPVKVIHLEDRSRNYFIVPILTNGFDEPWFVAQISCATGDLLRLDSIRAAQPDEDTWIYAVLNEKKAREKLATLLRPHLPDGWKSSPEPLVWKQCRFSHSPLHPFHKLERGPDDAKEYAYVDIHGDLHTNLDAPAPYEEEEEELPPRHDQTR